MILSTYSLCICLSQAQNFNLTTIQHRQFEVILVEQGRGGRIKFVGIQRFFSRSAMQVTPILMHAGNKVSKLGNKRGVGSVWGGLEGLFYHIHTRHAHLHSHVWCLPYTSGLHLDRGRA